MIHIYFLFYLMALLTGLVVWVLYFNYYLNHKNLLLKYFLFCSATLTILILLFILSGYYYSYINKSYFFYVAMWILYYIENALFVYYITMFVRTLLQMKTSIALNWFFRIISLIIILMLIIPFVFFRYGMPLLQELGWIDNHIINIFMGAFLIYYLILSVSQYGRIRDFRIKRLSLLILILYLVFFPFLFYEIVIIHTFSGIHSVFFLNFVIVMFCFTWNILAMIIYFKYQPFKPLNQLSAKKFPISGITEREREIAGMLLEGQSYNSIAKELFISYQTVKTHVQNIYRKLNVKSKMELLRLVQN